MLLFGIFLAVLFWMLLFCLKIVNFWAGMSLATFLLAALAVLDRRRRLRLDFKASSLFWASAIILALYLIFWVGNWLVATFLGQLAPQIGDIYGLKHQGRDLFIALGLLFVIGPGEEIFWRGYLQESLMERWGPATGYFLATALYTLVHLWSGNFMLVLAAGVAGAAWGLVYWRFRNLWPGIISHAVWDVLAFVILPYWR
ncbi:MAG: lysostaphin resistance A-like protein [Firmicutes bacterium]|nr:lysostaphin resistance A-like protein [Bacillota bacterium]MCL5040045.1 lysostaphin resistance A-like protein [Bacillota bacterium]